MNTTSASPVEESPPHGASGAVRRPGLVWDVPVRVFHWLMVVAFAGAWLTSDSEAWRLTHITLGYTMAALVVFRLAWGFAVRVGLDSRVSCVAPGLSWRT